MSNQIATDGREMLGSAALHAAEELARSDRVRARLEVHQALYAARAAHDDDTIALCLLLHARLSFAEQSFAEAHAFVLEAAAAAQAGSRPAQARVVVTLAGMWAQLGQLDEALASLEVALTMLDRECVAEIARAELVLGVLLARRGATEEGLSQLRDARSLFETRAMKHQMIECSHNEACALMAAGRVAEAHALARQTLAECVSADETLMRAHVEANVVEALVRLQRFGEALAFARVALSRAELHARGEIDLLHWCGAAQLGCGLHAGARETWLRALALSEEVSPERARQLRERLSAACRALSLEDEAAAHERAASALAPQQSVSLWRLRTLDVMTAYCKLRPAEARSQTEHAWLSRWDDEQASAEPMHRRLVERASGADQRFSYEPVRDLRSGELVALHAHGRLPDARGALANRSEYALLLSAGEGVETITGDAIEQCCSVLAAQRRRGGALVPMVIELAAVEVEQRSFLATIEGALARFELDAGLIEVHCVGSLTSAVASALEGARAMGLAISTRLSTSSEGVEVLSRIAFDAIEFGGPLIGAAAEHERASIVMQSLISVARRLSARSRAVGIDQRETLDRLLALGCEQGRGASFGAPLSPEEAVALCDR